MTIDIAVDLDSSTYGIDMDIRCFHIDSDCRIIKIW
jgi:hypothetical protein